MLTMRDRFRARSHTLCVAAFVLSSMYARTQTRYLDEVFTSLSVRSDVRYGSATGYTGVPVDLVMDIYQPSGDPALRRPVIVFIHGGAFIGGTKGDADPAALAQRFALRGYVTASIEYRKGVQNIFDRKLYLEASYRAVQDAKAAVRFFRVRENADSLRVDTTKIFFAGFSAGSVAALHATFMQGPELPPEIDTTLLGPIEGMSGNPGHSSTVLAILNCWGGMLDTAYIAPVDAPVFSVHATGDPVIPYGYGTTIFAGIPVFGSGAIHARLTHLGIRSGLLTMNGVSHGFLSAAYLDSTIMLASRFFYPLLGVTLVADRRTGIPVESGLEQNYPNPFNPSTTISYHLSGTRDVRLEVFDVLGRRVAVLVDARQSEGRYTVRWDGAGVASGIYLCRLTAGSSIGRITMLVIR